MRFTLYFWYFYDIRELRKDFFWCIARIAKYYFSIIINTETTLQRCSLEKCSENMKRTYRRTPIPKCDFIKVPFQNTFSEELLWRAVSINKFRHFLQEEFSFITQKIKIFVKVFFGKCQKVCLKLWIYSQSLRKSLTEKLHFLAVVFR